MGIITKAVNLYFTGRRKEIDHFRRNPEEVQHEQFKYLLEQGARTKFGVESGLAGIRTAEEFRQRMPIYDYDTYSEFIDRARRGEQNVVWPSEIKWFAKSSGTTGSKSKFIPVTQEGLRLSHMRGPKDIMAEYCHLHPESNVVHGKMLTLGGSKRIEREGEKAYSGDLSAILIENTPAIGNILRIPDKKTALIPDFDEKVKRICEQAVKLDVRSFTGVPSWNLVMLNRVLEYTGKSNILEVWPNMEIFIHGGMDFRPYAAQYRKIIPTDRMQYMETYNASEGFFAIAEEPGRTDMLLMLDYGTYYEFLPLDQLDSPQNAVPIEGVKKGVNYAMIITSCNGLWRYMIGDTVEFISTDPYTIRITGRTKHYINAFGEEVVIGNAEAAMQQACAATGAEVAEYTAAPIYMKGEKKGAHQWVVEFLRMPDSLERFTRELDIALQGVNSDYEAKRFKDTTLSMPEVTVVPPGTFVTWLRSRGMVGGQNKVPRLFNDRTWADQLIEYLPEMEKIRAQASTIFAERAAKAEQEESKKVKGGAKKAVKKTTETIKKTVKKVTKKAKSADGEAAKSGKTPKPKKEKVSKADRPAKEKAPKAAKQAKAKTPKVKAAKPGKEKAAKVKSDKLVKESPVKDKPTKGNTAKKASLQSEATEVKTVKSKPAKTGTGVAPAEKAPSKKSASAKTGTKPVVKKEPKAKPAAKGENLGKQTAKVNKSASDKAAETGADKTGTTTKPAAKKKEKVPA